jgi:hypothetical protein
MDLPGRQPNVDSLARHEDVEGLVEATSYRELVQTSPESVNDLGVAVRTDAILALGDLGEAGQEAVASALRDPADPVRCAAVRVLYARKQAGVLVQALRWLPAGKGKSREFALRAVRALQESLTPAALANALLQSEDDELLNEDDEQLILALLEEHRAEDVEELIQFLVSSLADERPIVADRAGDCFCCLLPPAPTPW